MKQSVYFVLFAVVLLIGCKKQFDQSVIDVTEFGIVANNNESITGKINRLIEEIKDAVPVTIIFPKGRYDFYPDSNYFREYFETNTYDVNPKRLGILIEKKKNITIDGGGSDFVFHGHMQPFTLDNAQNISIKNVNIDWDRPLTAESEVVESSAERVVLKIDTLQFPYKLKEDGIAFVTEDDEQMWRVSGGSWLIEYDRNHVIPAHTGDHGSFNGDLKNVKYSNIAPGMLCLSGNFTKYPPVGNFLIMRHSTRDHAGMFLFHSKNIGLENINIYHTAGLGVLSQYSENITARKVNLIPNSHKNRYLSGHDDGLHFMGCKGQIIVDSCRFQGLMDDPINIHGTCVPVFEKIDQKTLKCNFAHDMSCGLLWGMPGDTIGFIDNKPMQTIARGVLKSFTSLNKDTFLIEFEQAIPEQVQKGYALENLSCTPDVQITNCFAGSCRARGFLISTPGKVVVENNYFETSGSAILIAGDANYWFESGAVTDVLIRNNEFAAACNSSAYQFCEAIISIYPEIPVPDPARPFHRNIRIEENKFFPSDYPVLYALSVDGLRFSGNTIERTHLYEPWHPNQHTIILNACKNVQIKENKIGVDVLGKDVLLKNTKLETLIVQPDLIIKQ